MQAIEDIILGNSLAIKEMKKLVEMVSGANTTVLIQGETGSGKELVAEALKWQQFVSHTFSTLMRFTK